MVDPLGGGDRGFAAEQDVGGDVVTRRERPRVFAQPVLCVAGQFFAHRRNQQFAIGDAEQTDHHRRDDQRREDSQFGNAAGHQRGEFVRPLQPSHGEHRGDQRKQPADAVEKRKHARPVVIADHSEKSAEPPAVRHELFEIPRRVDHDVQPRQTGEADEPHLREESQDVAIDDQHGCVRGRSGFLA